MLRSRQTIAPDRHGRSEQPAEATSRSILPRARWSPILRMEVREVLTRTPSPDLLCVLHESANSKLLEDKHHYPHPQEGRRVSAEQLAPHLAPAYHLQGVCCHSSPTACHMGYPKRQDIVLPERIPPVRRMCRTLISAPQHPRGQQETKQNAQGHLVGPEERLWVRPTQHHVGNDEQTRRSTTLYHHLPGDLRGIFPVHQKYSRSHRSSPSHQRHQAGLPTEPPTLQPGPRRHPPPTRENRRRVPVPRGELVSQAIRIFPRAHARKPAIFFIVRMRGHAHEEKYGWLTRLVSSLA